MVPEVPLTQNIIISGIHAAPYEVEMTAGIVRTHIRPVYLGRISLVGSRAAGHWLSLNRFRKALHGFSNDEVLHWFHFLNTGAIQAQLARHEVQTLMDILPSHAPEGIKWFLNGTFGVPGSDIDLNLASVGQRPLGISPYYSDPHGISNQIIDIFPR